MEWASIIPVLPGARILESEREGWLGEIKLAQLEAQASKVLGEIAARVT
ncbi:hypothetical protein [Streptomyces sp. A1547]|nr:hypothetical protein [Streptomyces sp. A1547]